MSTARELLAEAKRAEALAAEIRRQAAEAALDEEAARRPMMPKLAADGTGVVVFSKYMSGREYVYAAVGWRAGRSVRWAVTSTRGPSGDDGRYNWPGLLAFIGEANWSTIKVVTELTPLITPEQEPPAVERMGPFGRVLKTETVNFDPDFGDGARGY